MVSVNVENEKARSGNILEFHNITKRFPGVTALNNVTFSVRSGCVHCIVGENGAGKSTLMKIINGMYKADEGEMVFDGKPWNPTGSAKAREGGIAMVHQELNIIPMMTIAQNLFLGREIKRRGSITMDDREMREQTRALMREYGLDFDPDQKMSELSIAEAQQIEILKCLSCNAKAILMDEPTSSLTEKEIGFLFDSIRKMRSQGITIIYISHKLEEIFEIGEYISVFRDGQHIETRPVSGFTKASMIEMMVGREMKEIYPPRTPKLGEVALRVEGFTRKGVFENITFEVRAGEILGIAGLVGAGRTEIARSIIALDPHDSGKVYRDGKEIAIHNVNQAIENGIAMISEDRRKYGLVLVRGIRENTSLVALSHLYNSKVLNLRKERELAERMKEALSIKAPNLEVPAKNLSGGNQQKVVLAKWMAVSPKVLIMDEPTRGIDVGTKYEIYKLMNQMTSQGIAIIMINSDMEELLGMSDRICVIHAGRLAGELSREEAKPASVMELATGTGGRP